MIKKQKCSGNRRLFAFLLLIILAVSALTAPLSGAAKRPPCCKLALPSVKDVRIEGDAFWSPRLETFRSVTLPYCFAQCEQTGRLANFDRAAGRRPGAFEGLHFNDSDVYKIIEGAALSNAVNPDPDLARLIDKSIARIAAAQQPDGYLHTYFTIDRRDQRFKHIHPNARHELYCMGHAIEAGATHFEVTGKRTFLDVAIKLADHIDAHFGPGKRREVPEHQELELALIKLYRVTGEKKYLDLGRFFIEERGNSDGHALYGEYSQDHKPVREQREIGGHAVRAMYHCIGMADLYAETGDPALLESLKHLWESTTHRKMYVTGGVGATSRGEAFSHDYELPNQTAYCETCAQIGLLLFAERMFCIAPKAEYADVMERVLYNGFLSGISLSGDRFFYQNRLASRGDYRRRPWYGCACCPSNVPRMFPKIGSLAYAVGEDEIFVNLYMSGTAKLRLKGQTVTITQETRYPWDGTVKLHLTSDGDAPFRLFLRIPEWLRNTETAGGLYRWARPADAVPALSGKHIAPAQLKDGFLPISLSAPIPTSLTLTLPMPILRVHAHERVVADRGRVALKRGPIVYCVEDVAGEDGFQGKSRLLDRFCLPPSQALETEFRADLLGGVQVIKGKGLFMDGNDPGPHGGFTAIPYYAWDNSGKSRMTVWFLEDPERAGPADTSRWIGTNYTPAHCVNQVQLWHEFKPDIINRELAAARKHFGLTTLRVYLHNLPYDADKDGFLNNIESFLKICDNHGIKPGLVFFDDCHRHDGITLKSLPPVKGWHNGRWAACPQDRERIDENLPKFKAYIQDVIRAHREDPRVLWWEIFNEPNMRSPYSARLRKLGYRWAKSLSPKQPVLSCWDDNPETDIVDAHNYSANFASWDRQTGLNPAKGTVFTEAGTRWYAGRPSNGEPCEVIHWLSNRKAAGLYTPGVYLCWELFAGNSNCRWYWGTKHGTPEPPIPWCGLMWPDTTPVSLAESEAIRRYVTGKSRALFFDDFQDRPVPERPGWTAYSSGGKGGSGVMKLDGTMKMVAGDAAWRDYVLEAVVMLKEDAGNAGLVFRVNQPGPGTDQMRGYYVGFDSKKLYLGKMQNNWQPLAEYDLTQLDCRIETNAWHMIRVAAEGPRIRVWFDRMHHDDGLRIDWVDEKAPILSGAVGFRTHLTHAWFDNVVVLPATALPVPAEK